MPRFKPADYGRQLLAVDLSSQLHPGGFEYTLHYLIECEVDLRDIEARYKNDEQGAWAYDPRVLLKIVLLAYSRGIISSRGMEAACCNDVLFMAISGNSAPHFSTLAHFVSSLGPAIDKIFAQVLTLCDRQGLIGRQMFAIDGVKLPSNASKAKSGKRKDYLRQVDKMERAAPSRNVKLRVIEVRQAAGLEQAFAKAARGAQGVLVLPDPMITAHRQRVASVAAKHRLPAVYYHRDFVDRGGLMAYGPELSTMSRRAADYIDMILRLMLLAFHAPNQPVGLPPDRARWTNSKFDGARSRDA